MVAPVGGGVTAASRGGDIAVERIESLNAIERLRDEWIHLTACAAEDSPFLTWEWLVSWWEAFAGDARMWLLVAREGDGLVGLAPLLLEGRRVLGRNRRVVAFWANEYSNRVNFITKRGRVEDCLGAFVDYLVTRRSEWDVVQLGPMLEASPVTHTLLRVLDRRRITHGVFAGYRSPYLPLPTNWDAIADALSASFRKTLKRKLNKAARMSVVNSEETVLAQRVEDAFAISEHTWQQDNGTAIGSTPALRRFYTGLAERTAAAGWLRLAFLSRDGRQVCFEYNLLYKNVLYNLKLGYLPSQSDWSPGLVLKYEVLRRLVAEGVRVYDFLGTDEPYKLHWTSAVQPHCEVQLMGRALDLQFVGFLLFRVRPWAKRRLPWLLSAKRKLAAMVSPKRP